MRRLSWVFALLASLGCKATCSPPPDMVHDFSTISPSTNLAWTPCFGRFQCSRLQVPLDYADQSLGTTAVAFIKLPAKNATTDSQSIMFIPGGPGGSGVDLLFQQADLASQALGEQHNIVSFDPRGIKNSGLTLDCFAGNTDARSAYIRLHNTGTTNVSTTALQEQFYSSRILADWCNASANKSQYYVTTPSVAYDLLAFVEAEAVESGKSPADAKLWAYAVSYGTVTGATFASMFPDRVGRMVLDGVIDAEQYYDNAWLDSIDQADAAIAKFSEYCHAAGQDNCIFWGPSAADITARLDGLIAQLDNYPIPVSGLGTATAPAMVTNADLKSLLFTTIYNPRRNFPGLADALHQLENGNATALAGTFDKLAAGKADAGRVIQCADTGRRNKLATIEGFQSYVEASIAKSKYVGDIWPLALDGPIEALKKPTDFPILFASNTIDPLSSLTSAKKASSLFAGSVLIQQEAVGHTVVDLGGSTCYFAHVQRYFAGVVPPANVTCPQQFVPFAGGPTL
ncbi:hypothetical protein Micbo1qcDRAFT_125041 [Microdochium bolleyi]|uniref:TAP-like protein-domain-containing protein n=1 Tax=Microdochium bolleyi TaxID=196109 RepID=A0A136IQ86_9PEZI|nr:hypothetical protein Micbo1qcDRAFT_125041 [Microdochium bolleyi]